MTWLFDIVLSNYLSEKTLILNLNIVYLFLFVCVCMRVCKIDNICEKFNSKRFEWIIKQPHFPISFFVHIIFLLISYNQKLFCCVLKTIAFVRICFSCKIKQWKYESVERESVTSKHSWILFTYQHENS